MTTASPAKRVNTSEENCAERPLQADELTARLRSVGSRVRKSVMEGYITDPSASTPRSSYSSPTKPTSALRSEARIFQSANDTLREVYSATPPGGYGVLHSWPNKRERARSEEPDGDTRTKDSDVEMHVSDSGAAGSSLYTFAGSDRGESRPIKPLKGSRRRLTQTRSLPIASFQFLSQPNGQLPDLEKSLEEDEDWSEDTFLDLKPRQEMDFDWYRML